ncbi:MAG TPA: hypothetical protein VM597_19475 [Gemmataceae bacterium]|jgi:hypothetical protein|nr:hypothetical protein [Gemmataceae bacterium]
MAAADGTPFSTVCPACGTDRIRPVRQQALIRQGALVGTTRDYCCDACGHRWVEEVGPEWPANQPG